MLGIVGIGARSESETNEYEALDEDTGDLAV